jgi:hypothetical protein
MAIYFLIPRHDVHDPSNAPRIPRNPTFQRHIVAVGDLHGDLPNALKVLEMAGVIDSERKWTGDVDFLVQTGDIVDRFILTMPLLWMFGSHRMVIFSAATILMLCIDLWKTCASKLDRSVEMYSATWAIMSI